MPHPPQFALSVCSLTQALPHLSKPLLHWKPQFVPSHVGVEFVAAGHELQDEPQPLVDAFDRQAPEHAWVPDGQLQALPWHVIPPWHVNAAPQPPQFVALTCPLDASLAHCPLQGVGAFDGQVLTQLYAGAAPASGNGAHEWLASQLVPQPPQFCFCDRSVAQPVPEWSQSAYPGAHSYVHAPFAHPTLEATTFALTSTVVQSRVQDPQACTLSTETQPFAQDVRPAGHAPVG